MSFSTCVCVLLVCSEIAVVLKAEGTEPVTAAALEMSQIIIIHTHVVDSDFQGLAGDVRNHKTVWKVDCALSDTSCHIVSNPS